jgi:hypothetical protein
LRAVTNAIDVPPSAEAVADGTPDTVDMQLTHEEMIDLLGALRELRASDWHDGAELSIPTLDAAVNRTMSSPAFARARRDAYRTGGALEGGGRKRKRTYRRRSPSRTTKSKARRRSARAKRARRRR